MIKKVVTAILLAMFLPFLLVSPIFAQQQRSGDNVVLRREETINQDFFVSGNNVTLAGTVNGDTYVAGGTVVVEGTINGDLLVIGGTVDLRGMVTEDVRAIGGQVNISGIVGGNVSTVGGAVNLTPSAQIVGNLTYVSAAQAQISPGAQVLGQITQRQPAQPDFDLARFFAQVSFVTTLISFLGSLIIGLLLLYFFPVFTQDVANKIWGKPWLSLLIGFLTVILFPILFIILLITLIGIPLALILLAVFLILMYLAKIYIALVVGQRLLSLFGWKAATYWALIIGLVIYELLLLIPVLGWIIAFLIILFGLGAILISLQDYLQKLRSKELL